MATPPPYNGTYTVPEQIAAFTFTANSAANLKFNSIQDMQNYVTLISTINLSDPVMQNLVGDDWESIFGPVVWVNPSQTGSSFVVDNTMAWYYSPSQNLIIIAIAGTNPFSMYDWLDEDFAVNTMVDWNTISTTAPSNSGKISTGAANGLNALLEMIDSATSLNALDSFHEYVKKKNIDTSTTTIAIGGHSLGGTLAPCLGLFLEETLTDYNISVNVYAGPTPGDQDFATYYEGLINGTSFSYQSQKNSLDLVPLAMAPSDLALIPDLFSQSIVSPTTPTNVFIGVLSSVVQVYASQGGNYTQIQTNFTTNTGTFNTNVDGYAGSLAFFVSLELNDTTYETEISNLIHFLFQIPLQHGPAYAGGTVTINIAGQSYTSDKISGFLGIEAYTEEYQLNIANNPPTGTIPYDYFSEILRRLTGINITKIPDQN